MLIFRCSDDCLRLLTTLNEFFYVLNAEVTLAFEVLDEPLLIDGRLSIPFRVLPKLKMLSTLELFLVDCDCFTKPNR